MRTFLKSMQYGTFLVLVGLGFLLLSVGSPDIYNQEPQPTCIVMPDSNSQISAGGSCPLPYKDGRFYDQGEGRYCYLVSVLNSNIRSGVNDNRGRFFNSMRECLSSYGVTLCSLANGVVPGSFEDEIIRGCKMLKMHSIGEPIGLDFFRLTTPWWDWQTETHSIVNLCARIRGALRDGGGAWMSIIVPGGTHSVSVDSAMTSQDGKSCIISIIDPNSPNTPNTLTVDRDNKIVKTSRSATLTQIGDGARLEDITIETKL